MASGVTNRGKYIIGALGLRGDMGAHGAAPGNWMAALVSASAVPTIATNTMTDLQEINPGNGYTQPGQVLERSSTGWPDSPSLQEDDATSQMFAKAKDLSWTASGGTIPSSGSAASFLVITVSHTVAGSRHVLAFFDLGGALTIPSGQTRTFQSTEIDLYE